MHFLWRTLLGIDFFFAILNGIRFLFHFIFGLLSGHKKVVDFFILICYLTPLLYFFITSKKVGLFYFLMPSRGTDAMCHLYSWRLDHFNRVLKITKFQYNETVMPHEVLDNGNWPVMLCWFIAQSDITLTWWLPLLLYAYKIIAPAFFLRFFF